MLERLRYTQWNEQCIVRHLCEFCFTDMLRAIVNFVAVYTLKLALICVAIGKSVIFFSSELVTQGDHKVPGLFGMITK